MSSTPFYKRWICLHFKYNHPYISRILIFKAD
uniref:Uncharacterized protein n=1 Tax=Siphoviridae sp. ctP0x5 TaxID=2827863 RepID=A0A8S5TFU4_9CAUD|nr:MAG TPA: hypothetical protein [Siphoviridae sp. ctP0x5]